MRISRDNIKKNAKFVFFAAVSMLIGLLLISSSPDEYTDFAEIYYTKATEYETVALENVYPLGILGSETENGKEYTYYLFCTCDASSTMTAAVLKTADSDFAELFEAQSPVMFEKTLYGKALPLTGQPKESFDEMVSDENLAQSYAVADWYFEDSMQNIESQTTICILGGCTFIIIGIALLCVFLHKIFKKNSI